LKECQIMAKPKSGRTPEGQALLDVVVETTHTFFRLRATGAKFGATTPTGGSTLGLLRSLKSRGPLTVPEIARMRPVARQHIQKLANQMAADGLVEFIDNPAHKRSKLLRLTSKGERAHDELLGHMVDLAESLAGDMDPEALRITAKTLADLRSRLEAI
jgi:DNA-binding MarR family transcriptional regulator